VPVITKNNAVAGNTTDAGKIRLGGACRLPVKTADAAGMRPEVSRPPAKTSDLGKIRLGGACRLPD
jgi:hypothetical protein